MKKRIQKLAFLVALFALMVGLVGVAVRSIEFGDYPKNGEASEPDNRRESEAFESTRDGEVADVRGLLANVTGQPAAGSTGIQYFH